MKKSTIAIITSLCISAILMIIGIALALNYGDSFKNNSNTPIFIVTVGCFILSAGLCGATIGIALVLPHFKKLNPSVPAQLDERQSLITGKGAEYALTAIFFVAVAMSIWEAINLPQFAQPSVLLLLTTLLGFLVYSVYRVWNGAYFAINKDKKSSTSLFTILIVIALLAGLSDLLKGRIIADGLLTHHCLPLAGGIYGLILLATIGIKNHVDRKDDEA